MGDEIFLSAVTKITSKQLDLAGLIGIAEALKNEGQHERIIQLYTLWVGQNPTDPYIHAACFNLAVLQSDAGLLEDAKQTLEKAIAINPDFYPAYINLGNVLERLGNAGEAVNQWTLLANKLGAVNGPSVSYKLTALKQIGRVLENNRLQPNAELVLKQSLDIHPNQPDVLQHYIALRLAQCEWPIVAPWEGVDRKTLLKGAGPLSVAIYTDDPLYQLAAGHNYCRNFIGYPQADYADRHAPGTPKKKLRIGYISSDLRNHAVGFIMAELFEVHDARNVDVYAYYCGIPYEDPLQERIRGAVANWVDITKMSDTQAAERIMADGIDILVDVNGYTKDARTKIFAMRPAPVIVNWLGFPGTMASPYHHYIVADDWIIPEAHEAYFSERVKRLPCYQPNDRKRIVAEHTPTRAEAGLPEDAFVFCSFNGAQKISRFTFERWMEILKRTENSVLWILESSAEINQRLRGYAEKMGVAPDRLYFAPKMGNPEHLARYRLADLFLDNLPYGAHVTASDALWMGVPILTLSGRGFAARVCGSLVRAAGLPELVTTSHDAYIARAVELANDPAQVRALKEKLAKNRDTCILFDTDNLARHLESLYQEMWSEYCNGDLPVPDLINLDTYLDIACEFDHDASEMMRIDDYEGFYRSRLAARHRYCRLPSDTRLRTEAETTGKRPKPKKAAA